MTSIRQGKSQKMSATGLNRNRTLVQVLILLACSLIGAQAQDIFWLSSLRSDAVVPIARIYPLRSDAMVDVPIAYLTDKALKSTVAFEEKPKPEQ